MSSPLPDSFWPRRLPHQLELPQAPVHQNLAASVLLYSDKVAMRYQEQSITYRELQDAAARIAGFLSVHAGVKKGDRVAIWLQNCPEYVVATYAAWMIGAVVVPLSPMLTSKEIGYFFRDAGARVGVIDADFMPRTEDLVQDGLIDCMVVVGDAPHRPDLAVSWQQAAASEPATVADTGPDDLALLPYTSGTTGVPRGCMLSHRSLQATIQGAVQWCQHTASSVHFAVLPFFHVTGFQQSMNAPIASGGTIIMMKRWDKVQAERLIRQHRVTSWVAITAMLVDFMNDPAYGKDAFTTIRFIAGGGAAIPQVVHQRVREVFGTDLIEGYGLTETISQTHLNPPDRPKQRCVGLPTFNTRSMVVDADLQPLGANAQGEIVVHGPQVMNGYWKKPEETAAVFFERDGVRWFRTGDLGYFDDEGYFFVVDRIKRMINAAGYKVWPAEVEAILYSHPAVAEACVIGVTDAHRGETTKALIILKPGAVGTVSEADIIGWSREQMAAYKYPRLIEFVSDFPRLASGKIDWRTVQSRARENSL
ncbi:MAG TPA: AMP-binding protein [Rubrivivax sp.]|nr:AMP-binding protein [Rubrivivax sp.]